MSLSNQIDLLAGAVRDKCNSLSGLLDGKADASHSHATSDITGLQTALDGKASLSGATFTGNLSFDGNSKGVRYFDGVDLKASSTWESSENALYTDSYSGLTFNAAASNSIKLAVDYNTVAEVTSDGLTVSGDQTISATSPNLTLRSTEAGGWSYLIFSDSTFNDAGTLEALSGNINLRGYTGKVVVDGYDGVDLQYNFTTKLSVTNTGVTVAGGMAATGAVTGSNLSGTNTGDESSTTILTKLSGASGGGTTNFLRADGTWAAPSGGGGGSASWGGISGTLSDQTDLQTALNGKLSTNGGTLNGNLTITGSTYATLSLQPNVSAGGAYLSFKNSSGSEFAYVGDAYSGSNYLQLSSNSGMDLSTGNGVLYQYANNRSVVHTLNAPSGYGAWTNYQQLGNWAGSVGYYGSGLNFAGVGDVFINSGGRAYIAATNGVSLDYGGSIKLQTFNTGVAVTGTLTANNLSGTNTGDQDLSGIEARLAALEAMLAGGTTGQSLVKQSNADYDFQWQ